LSRQQRVPHVGNHELDALNVTYLVTRLVAGQSSRPIPKFWTERHQLYEARLTNSRVWAQKRWIKEVDDGTWGAHRQSVIPTNLSWARGGEAPRAARHLDKTANCTRNVDVEQVADLSLVVVKFVFAE